MKKVNSIMGQKCVKLGGRKDVNRTVRNTS